ncbi:MAG: D-glycero-beta-D-manno-heptose 1-phosphate adenylyltransferase [Phycisphaeraceae bacterium]|nr:MAG: D-glycero-beta-D-manno-heptose 1-phosphate adenylyltransferase [Phycisphaeraceae bacterium]
MEDLLNRLSMWKPFSAMVVGDFMLDQLLYGNAERLSADAPVPILDVRRHENRAGGAANVCLDLAAMGGKVFALGVTGEDNEGATLKRELERRGVDAGGMVADKARPTTVKRSLVGLAQARHPQKMFRVDFESREPLSDAAVDAVIAAVAERLADVDVVCIEDYRKGVCGERLCQAVIGMAIEAGKPVLVDPALIDDYTKYRGATAITPNRTEAELATGLRTHHAADSAHNAELAHALLNSLDLEAVVLTLDRHGALLLERGAAEPLAVPTVARDVYDVTGAGDMMLAALAAAIANGIDWAGATKFANAAAGIEVEVFGVVPIPFERIHAELLRHHTGGAGALRTLDQLLIELAAVRSSGNTVVFTNGCFDVLHAGHVQMLREAANLGDYLIVGLNNDDSVRRLKGDGRPINNVADRARVLGALRAVDAVVSFGEDTPERLLKAIKPDVLVKGGDYAEDEVVGREIVEASGGRVVVVGHVRGKSTTELFERVRTS